MIEVRDLVKAYPGVLAVDHVSFRIERGEVVGFLGPNGAGKTTTMRVLTGFIAPTSGSATVAGFDVVRQSMEVRRRIGYLPENNPLYLEMRVEEYINFRATIKKVPHADLAKRVGDVLDRVHLIDRRQSIIGHLSKGFRQRVGLADAIVHNPEVVILDEPTIGLDPVQVRDMREVIRDLGKDRTVLLSSHILPEVEKVCGRVLIINRGKIAEMGTPEEIANRLLRTGRVRLEVRGDGKAIKEALDGVPGVARILWSDIDGLNTYIIQSKEGSEIRSAVFNCCAERKWEVLEFGYERLSLEEAFTILTASDQEKARQHSLQGKEGA